MKRYFICAVWMVLLFGSCRAPKDVSLFQGIGDLTAEQKAAMNQKWVPRICVDDALIINVTSADRETVSQFSPPPFGYYMPGEAEIGISATTQNLFTYLVDENGYINFPVLGRIHVAGLSINETTRLLEDMIHETAPSAVVHVQISNFKVGIMGEVKTSDVFMIKTARLTILELIALAGDLTITADRKNVWIHRDNNGEKIQVKMDLTDPAIFASPYYYLQQNDMVYVMPNEAQKRNSRMTTSDNTRVQLFAAIVTAVSIISSNILVIRGQNR